MAGSSEMHSKFLPLGEMQEDAEAQESQPPQEKVIALINEAQLVSKDKKLECLHQVKELITKKNPDLLDSFLDEVIAFQQDSAPDVRKFVVNFMEDACKADSGLLVRVIPMLNYMMEDTNTNVIKRVMTCVVQLYKLALMYVSKLKTVEEEVQEMWEILQETRLKICDMIESDNDGVRTMAIKFMEVLILAQTKKEPDSEAPKGTEVDISLDTVSPSHPVLKASELREEAGTAMGSMLALTASPTVSSVNLMACISCLTNIARQRPSNISTVVQTFELLHGNLPPHFAISQVTSVRKQLKGQILSLLRHPASFECREQITTLLTDLGCTQVEIAKNTPKPPADVLKRTRNDVEGASSSKKTMFPEQESSASAGAGGEGGEERSAPGIALMEAIEMTTNELKPLLVPEAVTEVVLANMKNLPRQMPRTFKNSYTPIAAAGTDAQVTHLARLLASQMTSAGIGVGARTKGIQPQRQAPSPPPPRSTSPIVRDPRKRRREGEGEEGEKERDRERGRKRVKEEEEPAPEPELEVVEEQEVQVDLVESMAELSYLGNLLGLPPVMDPMFPLAYGAFFGAVEVGMETEKEKEKESLEPKAIHTANLVAIPTTPKEEEPPEIVKKEKRKHQPAPPQKLKKIRMFNPASAVKPLTEEQCRALAVAAFRRILAAEKMAAQGGAGQDRIRLIITLVTQFGGEFNDALLDFILADLKAHFDLAVAWLYAEYGTSEGYLQSAQNNLHYDSCLTGLLRGAKARLDARERLFTRLVLEAPRITPSALEIIQSYCHDEDRAFLGLTTLKELVLKRPQASDEFLQALLEVTMSDIELARVQALHVAKKFYTKPELSLKIERFALHTLQYLLADHPTFQQPADQEMEVAVEWTEESAKMCLGLFLSLLPISHRLLKDLTIVYTSTSATVKRIILKQLDQPVRAIGMDSPELLQLVENCPQGGETLIMRMLHILTDSAPPSAELVKRVRELYHKNSSDVRFLIPVLHGLQKQEVIAALPKFIKLSPTVVKGVFDRLLVSYKGDQGHSISPVTPSELLIALHNIDCKNDETLMKAIIKATNLCFAEKSVYTQEVLAVVLQQLLEQTPIPMLFMRTVIQSLGVCPKLMNFVMTILTKLISKQVWKQPKVWQGFVKCCEVTKPHSYQVLLQLPPRQLENVLEVMSPGIREPLVAYVQSLTPHQRACIPRHLLQTIEKEPEAIENPEGRRRKSKSEKRRRQSSRSTSDSVKEPGATS